MAKWLPLLSPGLTYEHPALCHDPHEIQGYQILENVMSSKVAGYSMYAGSDLDLGDMKAMAWANSLIAAAEDIILDGEINRSIRVLSPKADVPAVKLPGDKAPMPQGGTARAKRLGDRLLVLVSDYTTFGPEKKTLTIGIPPVAKDSAITDVETRQKLVDLAKGQGSFQVELGPSRARVLLCQPR